MAERDMTTFRDRLSDFGWATTFIRCAGAQPDTTRNSCRADAIVLAAATLTTCQQSQMLIPPASSAENPESAQ